MYREQYARYQEAQKVASRFIDHPDVNDVLIGNKHKDGDVKDQVSIRFNVDVKKPKSKLKSHEMLPKKIGGFTTDVTEFKPKKQVRLEDPSLLVRPLIGGLQIQSSLFTDPLDFGTMGAAFRISGRMYGITNFHVAFGDLADGATTPFNVRIVQPKHRNFGEEIGIVSSVNDVFLDYALFALREQSDGLQSINGFRGQIEGFTNPVDGMSLFKFGAATGRTFGIFDARSLISKHRIVIRFNPGAPNDTGRISAGGDSGSLWVTQQNATPGNVRMVALHYGGDPDKNVAFATLFSSISPSIRNHIPAA